MAAIISICNLWPFIGPFIDLSISRRGLVNPSTLHQSLNVPGYKKLLYYALVVRPPFDGYPPLIEVEYITSDRTKDSVELFLSQIQKNLLSLVIYCQI